MYQEISQETSLHQGEIKIFLWQKGDEISTLMVLFVGGYGFINCPDFGGDVYFQRTNLSGSKDVAEVVQACGAASFR